MMQGRCLHIALLLGADTEERHRVAHIVALVFDRAHAAAPRSPQHRADVGAATIFRSPAVGATVTLYPHEPIRASTAMLLSLPAGPPLLAGPLLIRPLQTVLEVLGHQNGIVDHELVVVFRPLVHVGQAGEDHLLRAGFLVVFREKGGVHQGPEGVGRHLVSANEHLCFLIIGLFRTDRLKKNSCV